MSISEASSEHWDKRTEKKMVPFMVSDDDTVSTAPSTSDEESDVEAWEDLAEQQEDEYKGLLPPRVASGEMVSG